MKVGIFYHENKVSPKVVSGLLALLNERGAEVECFSSEDAIHSVDRLIILGGDGAVLRAARRASVLGIPIVGVNYGRLGFLTEFERGEEAAAVELALDEHCRLLHRAMLEVRHGDKVMYCLNELALMRRIAPDSEDAVVRLSVEIDGTPAGEFTSDGLIVCTPTGSTAYSLSAGGIILTPDCNAFLLTPVNAFSMRSRPIACADKSELTFSLPHGGDVVMHCDGIFLGEMRQGDLVTVRKSQRYATFLTKGRGDFFRRLTEKIN